MRSCGQLLMDLFHTSGQVHTTLEAPPTQLIGHSQYSRPHYSPEGKCESRANPEGSALDVCRRINFAVTLAGTNDDRTKKPWQPYAPHLLVRHHVSDARLVIKGPAQNLPQKFDLRRFHPNHIQSSVIHRLLLGGLVYSTMNTRRLAEETTCCERILWPETF